MAIPPVTTLPPAPSRNVPSTFSATADTFLAALPPLVTELNTFGDAVEVAEASATAAAAICTAAENAVQSFVTVSEWVSGTTYAIGDVRWSPINYYTYRRKSAGAGTIDPSLDTANWENVSRASRLTTFTPYYQLLGGL